jgi:SPP1 gp7 family putative phage head morphogenesis protein
MNRRNVAYFIRLRYALEQSLFRSTRTLLNKQGKSIEEGYNANGEQGALSVINMGELDFQDLLTRFYKRSIGQVGLAQLKNLIKKTQKEEFPRPERFVDLSQEWILAHSLKESSTITGTSRKIAEKVISDGVQEGLASKAIANQLRKTFSGSLTRTRAQMIARTETGNASSYAQDLGARESGVEYMKEWIAVTDDATRDGHVSVSGQRVGKNDNFVVTGFGGVVDHMPHPNSDGASAGNVINCRCVIGYDPID